MAVRFLLVLTCFSLACCLVWAAPAKKVIVRSEEGRWITEIVGTAADGWPEIVSRHSFVTKKQAYAQKLQWEQNSEMQFQSNVSFKPLVAKGTLWDTTQAWSEEWERKYAKWIEEEVDAEFFVRNKIETDCADVAYSLRWIFSRINGLPAAAGLGESNVLLTNETVRASWANLPTSTKWNEDRRFLAALNYLLDMTYTHTLWVDSFPVALNKDALLSGSYHLGLRDVSGHTQVIHWLNSQAGVPFMTLNSTVPRAVRSLTDSLLFAGPATDRKSAILRFRWPVKTANGMILKKATEMPGYSEEQFSFKPDKDYLIALFEKLGYTGGVAGIRDYLYKDIFDQLKMRADLVREAVVKCQNNACPPGSEAYEEWSTPSRDSRIKGKMESLASIRNSSGGDSSSPLLKETIVTIEGVPWTFQSMIWNWKFNEFDSDPQVSEAQRWGAGKESWVQKHLQFLRTKMAERAALLKKGAQDCTGKNCSFGTELWKKTSSNSVDSVLDEKVYYLQNSGGAIPSETMKLFAAQSDQTVANIAGADLSLEFVMTNHRGMNSSALAPVEKQWALGPWSVLSAGLEGSSLVGDKWLLSGNSGRPRVINLETGKSEIFPFTVLRAMPGTTLLLVDDGSQLGFYDLFTKQISALPSEIQDLRGKTYFTDAVGLVVDLKDRLQVWSWSSVGQNLQLAGEVLGSDWVPFMAGMFISAKEGLFDARSLKTSKEALKGRFYCANGEFVVFDREGLFLYNRKAGAVSELGVKKATSFSCDAQVVISEENKKLVLNQWDENSQVHRVMILEFTQCYPQSAKHITCAEGNGYTFTDGQWKKDDPNANPYKVIRKNEGPWQLVDNSTGKTVLSAARIELLENRYAMVKLADGESVHVVDLQKPAQPILTNLFKATWGFGGSRMGPYFFLTGYGDTMASSVLWKP